MKKITISLFFMSFCFTSFSQWKDGGTKITTIQNVGIGTVNPGCKLDVAGDTKSTNYILSTEGRITRNMTDNFTYQEKSMGHYAILWSSDSWDTGGSTLWQSAYGGIKFFTRGLSRMGINSQGNVGIGTESPISKLDVNGTLSANALYLRTTNTDNGWRNTMIEYDGHNFVIGSKTGINAHNQLVLKPGGAGKGLLYSSIDMFSTTANNEYIQKIKIATEGKSFINAGNIGIGTENPQNKLDVVGTIRATEVKVETGWADFVFDKDYKLPTLDEVENHINEHKHLPDIPSEKEVKENGVSLGEMQAKLLQKIEELTLYVIQQDKTIKNLEDKVQKLEAK